jgi:hypothetical protein
MPVEVRFSALIQTGPGAHPASYTISTGSFPGVKSGRGVTLTPHPFLVLWSWKSIAIPLVPLWAVQPIESLSACTRAHFNPLNADLNPICHLLALLGSHHILHVSRIRVKFTFNDISLPRLFTHSSIMSLLHPPTLCTTTLETVQSTLENSTSLSRF